MGQLLTPYILAALDRAKLVAEDATDPQENLRDTYLSAPDQFEEAEVYFEDWLAAEAPASSRCRHVLPAGCRRGASPQRRDDPLQCGAADVGEHSTMSSLVALDRCRYPTTWRVLPRMYKSRCRTNQRADYVVARGSPIFFDGTSSRADRIVR